MHWLFQTSHQKCHNCTVKGQRKNKCGESSFPPPQRAHLEGPTKSPLLNIIPGQASIPGQRPSKAITLWPREFIPDFLPPLDFPSYILLREQLLIARRHSVCTFGIMGPCQHILIHKGTTATMRKNVIKLNTLNLQPKDRPLTWSLPSCFHNLPLGRK